MPYPRKVPLITADDLYGNTDSEREYITHKIDSTVSAPYDYYDREGDRAFRTFYEDDETGIITTDVAKFEAWMARIDPPQPGTPAARKAFENGSTVTCADLGHAGSYIYQIPCTDPDAHRPFQRPVC